MSISIEIGRADMVAFAHPTFIAALISFVGGIVVLYVTSRSRKQELFIKSLEYLKGGTQSRTAGIAILEKYLFESYWYTSEAVSILVGQGLHLIDKDKGIDFDPKKNPPNDMDRLVERYNFQLIKSHLSNLESRVCRPLCGSNIRRCDRLVLFGMPRETADSMIKVIDYEIQRAPSI